MFQEASSVWHYGETLSLAGWFHLYEWTILATHKALELMNLLGCWFLVLVLCFMFRHDQKTQWELMQQAFFVDVCFYISLVCRSLEFSITLKPKPVLTKVEYSFLIARLTTTQGHLVPPSYESQCKHFCVLFNYSWLIIWWNKSDWPSPLVWTAVECVLCQEWTLSQLLPKVPMNISFSTTATYFATSTIS